jgi:hypothetical protein
LIIKCFLNETDYEDHLKEFSEKFCKLELKTINLIDSISDKLKRITKNNFIEILTQNNYKLQQILISIQTIIKLLIFLSNDNKVKNLYIDQATNKDSIILITDNYFKFFKKHLWQIDHELNE